MSSKTYFCFSFVSVSHFTSLPPNLFSFFFLNLSYLEVTSVYLQKVHMSLSYFSIGYDSWLQMTENPAHNGLSKKKDVVAPVRENPRSRLDFRGGLIQGLKQCD